MERGSAREACPDRERASLFVRYGGLGGLAELQENLVHGNDAGQVRVDGREPHDVTGAELDLGDPAVIDA